MTTKVEEAEVREQQEPGTILQGGPSLAAQQRETPGREDLRSR